MKSDLNNNSYFCLVMSAALLAVSAHSMDSQTLQAGDDVAVTHVTAMRVEADDKQYPMTQVGADTYPQATHISDALSQVPSVWISKGGGQENLTAIRSPVYVGAGACGAFGMSEDSLSLRAANFCNVNQLFDANYIQANSIDVLRGPGSPMSGSNAIHGVINVVSPQFTDKPNTKIGFSDSSHGFNRYSVDHRSEKIIAQALLNHDDGYKDDSGYQQSKLRLKQFSPLNDQWNLAQNFNYMHLDQDTAGYIVGEDAYKDADRKKENLNPGFRKAESYRYAANFNFSPREGALLQLTPYLRSNDMEFSMHWLSPSIIEENGHDSIGLKSLFTRSYGAWLVHTGFDIDYTEAYLKQKNSSAALLGGKIPAGEHYDYDVGAISTAIFANAQYVISNNWTYSIGTRLDYLRLDYSNNLAEGSACDPAIPVDQCRYYRPADSSDRFSDWSPRTSLTWEFLRQQFASINLSRTYQSPQATQLYRLEQGQQYSDIDSIKADNAEIVFNGSLVDLSYSLSGYYMKKRNVIIKNNDKLNIDGQKTRHQGIELSLQGWFVDKHLEFVGSYAYGKHQYDSSPHLLFASGINIKGNIMDTAPRHLGSFKFNWYITKLSIASIEQIYLDDYYLNPENTNEYDGHTLSNVYFTQYLPWQVVLSAVIKNAFDVDYADRADVQPFSNNTSRYFVGEPRSYQLTVTKTF